MKIQILDELWDVYFVPPYFPVFDLGNDFTIGVCDGLNNRIYIANNLDYEKTKEVLQHEISHAIAFATNMPLKLSEENMAGFNGMYADEIYKYARDIMYDYGFL